MGIFSSHFTFMKILSNLPIENLTKENDYLGIIEKGDMIVSLLNSDAVDLSEIKMFALYSNWGSGKSTLMKYMQKQFDAWQYEKIAWLKRFPFKINKKYRFR